MQRAFQEIHLFTWNYADHDLACLSAFPDSRSFYSSSWVKPAGLTSVLYVSTCNRIELYIECEHKHAPIDISDLLKYFQGSLLADAILKHTPVYKRGLDSVRHLFQMASGLKSMALGETQITGQLKRDVALSREAGYLSPFVYTLIQKVLESQKKIRSETKIGQNPISLISLLEREIQAIDENNLKSISNAVIGGTGDMSQKAIRFLLNKGIQKFTVLRNDVTRDLPSEYEKIINSENVEVKYYTWEDLASSSIPGTHQIFITSTNAEAPLLNLEKINKLRSNGFLDPAAFVVDFGIPPNIDYTCIDDSQIDRIVNLNTLLKQSKINKNLRGMHLREALPIIEKSIHVFWMDYLYTRNPELVTTVLKRVEKDSQDEWQTLLSGPLKNISEKQKRILVDYMKKQERKALRTHKELFVDMLTIGEEEVAVDP
jgi:glutamyl-tRNA reductase